MTDFIPVNEPLLNGNEKKYLLECIDTGWISSEGPFVAEFEHKFAKRVGRKHAIAVTNGTAALDASFEALGICAGDEVIVPTFTIISCVGQIIRNGAKPVFVDCDLDDWNMLADQVEQKITPKTKAILMVHIFGLTTDISTILDIAERHNLKVIEDAAELIGQTYDGKPCGSFGDISTFSFYPNKHITTGEGGMIVTNDDNLAEECRSLRNLCFQKEKRFIHERLGWNLRMTNMQAAVGLAQLEQLDTFVDKKRSMGALYTRLLSNIDGLQLPLVRNKHSENIYWVYGVVLGEDTGLDAENMMKKLAERGIGTRPFFYPMHMQPVLHGMGLYKGASLPNSEKLYKQGFYVPSGLALSENQIHRVAETLSELMTV